MEVPFPPSPDDRMGTEFDFEIHDELSLLISDLGVADEALMQHGECFGVATGGNAMVQVAEDERRQMHGCRNPISHDVAEERIARTRERNRKAQARYRQKLKDQCVSLELQVTELQARLRTALDKRESLQHAREESVNRFVRANDSMPSIASQALGPQLAHAPGSPTTPQSVSQPGVHNAVRLRHSHNNPSASFQKTMIRSSAHRGLCTDSNAPPAPIHSYSHMAGISYDMLHRAANSFLDDPRSCQGARSVIEQYKNVTADSLSCSPSQVCWFCELYPQVAPGVHLSYSSSLSSPECVASFLLCYMCSSLEFGMITAALDHQGMGIAYQAMTEHHDPKRLRTDARESDAAPMSTDSEATPFNPPSAPLSGTPSLPCACLPRATAESRGTYAWSGAVRCGVNGAACARSATTALLRAAVEPYIGLVPREVVRRLLRATARQVRGSTEGAPGLSSEAAGDSPEDGGHTDAAGTGGGRGAHAADKEYQAGILKALYTMIGYIASDAEALEEELPALEERCKGRAAPARQWLLQQACKIMSAMGLGYMEMFRSAPRTIRRLAFTGVMSLISFYEVENMQATLYRSLHTTAQQRDRMAAYWSVWERRKRELDDTMHAAREALRGLTSADIPLPLLAHITAIANSERACMPPRVPGTVGAGAVVAGDGAVGPEGAVRLLGSCAEATVAARDAMEALWAVHAADAELYVDTLDLQMQPGLLLGLEQEARVNSVHLMLDTAPMDFMALCQMARTQQHREEMFSRRARRERAAGV